MIELEVPSPELQDHQAYKSGSHDFQKDIETLANSELIGTILETILLATNMRFAAVARVTQDRWVACRTIDEVNFGLSEGDEIEIKSTFCRSVRETGDRVLFSDVATDDVYGDHPIAKNFGIVSYASIPIYRADGSFFGTLCAIDTVPREVKDQKVIDMLEMFASVVSKSLETEEQLAARDLLIEKERELMQIQEEFVAVLGHDLRNPLAALKAGLRQLNIEQHTPRSQKILPHMGSSVRRMSELIDNIMMHAKSRLGGGIRINANEDAPLVQTLIEVVDEFRIAAPEFDFSVDLDIEQPVCCDEARIAQAISNFISNAINHGDYGSIIKIEGKQVEDGLLLSVINQGKDIPEDLRQKLFEPFLRGQKVKSEGLGLGLFIAASIARAHGGQVDVLCEGGTTAFQIKLPNIYRNS